MRWRTLAGLVVLTGPLVGCLASRPSYLIDDGGPPVNVPAQAGGGTVARSQKPAPDTPPADDAAPPTVAKPPAGKSWLDVMPQRSDKGATGDVRASIAAIVNGQPILVEEVVQASMGALIELRKNGVMGEELKKEQAKIYAAQLQELINRELVVQDAVARLGGGKNGNGAGLEKLKEAANKEFDQMLRKRKAEMHITSDEEFRKVLAAQDVTLDGMRRQFQRSFIYKEYLRYNVMGIFDTIGRQELLEYFQGHPEEFQGIDSVEWQDVFLDVSKYHSREEAMARAQDIAAQLRKGENIKQVLKYDDSPRHDGEGYGHERGQIRPAEAEPILFNMKEGDVDILPNSSAGIHVLRLTSREHPGPLPFADEKVQTRIRDKLRNEIGNREIQRILAELKRNAVIEIANGH